MENTEIKNTNDDTRTSRLIWDPKIARKLCHRGHCIIDIKAYRGNPDRSVFIFENTDSFKSDLEEISAEYKSKEDAYMDSEAAIPEMSD